MKILPIFATQNGLLAILFSLFVLKGLFFALLIPPFQNPDEQVHYGTVQHWAEPDTIGEPQKNESPINTADIRTSGLPEEIRETAFALRFDEIKFQNQNTQNFDDQDAENRIKNNTWQHFVATKPSMISGTWSWYYLVSAWIEQQFVHADIFTRILVTKTFSILLGTIIVLLAYLTFRKIHFSHFTSLLLTTLLAFQPMLGVTAAQINIDIAIVFSFSLFIFTGVWILRDGVSWKNSLVLILSALLGFFAKGPGIVLIAALIPLLSYAIWIHFGETIRTHIHSRGISLRSFILSSLFVFTLISIILLSLVPTSYLTSITHASAPSKFDSPLTSLSAYLDKTIDIDAFRWSAVSYWGNFGWLDTRIGDSIFNAIWTIEIIGLIGILLYLVPWHPKKFPLLFTGTRDFLPEKKYLLFLLLLSLALQGAIRFYDWRVFDATIKILIGTPGRYFLPNIIAHFTLLVTGLGFFCRSRVQFQWLLKSLLVGIVLLNFYALFTVILPRYYL